MQPNPIRFTIPGPCVPKGRPRVTKTGRAFTPLKTKQYESKVRVYAVQAVARVRASWSRTWRYSVTLRVFWPDARRRDLDNAAKACTDAMLFVAYDDDSQIVELHVYGEIDRVNPRVEVTIARREERAA